jgi:hypothetical protein
VVLLPSLADRSRLNGGSREQKHYVHRAGIYCGRTKRQVSREFLEVEFLKLIRLMTVEPILLETMITFATETSSTFHDDKDIETQRTTAIAKCKRRLEAVRHLYEDGEISREEYLKRKEQNEQEISHWQLYTTQTQHMVSEIVLCVEALSKLSQLWEVSSNEDRNRMAHQLFDYVVFDLDSRRIVDFKVKAWAEHFIVVRAANLEAEDKSMYGKCDPGRVRTYDTPLKRRVLYH